MEALRFNGSGSEYFKIWIVNILLTIITLGLYLPWAKVRNRRYFYANSALKDRNFEYHATGKQLFLGYLIGIVFFIIYNIVGQLNPALALLMMLILFLAIPWLIWRSLMFNMKMTSFSNVRFTFKGKAGRAYMIYLGYPALFVLFISLIGVGSSVIIPALQNMNPVVITVLGIVAFVSFLFAELYLVAIMKKSSIEYRYNNTTYGQGIFDTKIETKKFLILLFKTAGLAFIPMLFIGVVANMIIPTMIGANPYQTGASSVIGGAELFIIIAYFLMIFMMMLVGAYFVSRERKYVYENTLLDNKISFASTLRARSLAWVMVSNFFLILFTLGLAFPWAKVRVARLMLENTLVDTSVGFDAYLSEKQDEVSAIGDQIGDAFDVDVGIAL